MVSIPPYLLPVLLLLLSLLPLSLSTQPPTADAPNLIQNKDVQHHHLLRLLRRFPPVQTRLAISNATNTSSVAASLAHSATDPSLRSCAARYSDAREALRWSLDAMSTESYDYTFVHVSATAEYRNVFRVLFRRYPRLTQPGEMGKREVVLMHLCTMALEIISLLG